MSRDKVIDEKRYLGTIEDYNKFILPDMGDYMADDMSLEYMGELAGIISGENSTDDFDESYDREDLYSILLSMGVEKEELNNMSIDRMLEEFNDRLSKNMNLLKAWGLDNQDFMGLSMPQKIRAVSKAIGSMGKDAEESLGKDYAFFAENPYSLDLGYDPDMHTFVINAKPSWSSSGVNYIDNNVVDGDTLNFTIPNSKSGNEPFEIAGRKFKSFEEYVKHSTGDDNNEFSLRLVGIDTAELPHYKKVDSSQRYKEKVVEASKLEDLGSNYIYEVNKDRGNSDKVTFYEIDGKFHEFQPEHKRLVSVDSSPKDKEYHKDAKRAQELAKDMLDRAIDKRIVIDAKTITKNGKYDRNDGFLDILESTNSGSGYNMYGMDAYRRFLGAVYVKIPFEGKSDGEWINLNKYILANTNKTEALAHTDSNGNFLSDAFRIWSYDYKNFKLQDLPGMNDLDDVKELQSKISQKTQEELYEWTVTIGDNMFIVPPTSIRVVSQSMHERVALLRAKGSMTKSSPKTDRLIELELYFNEETGINGTPVQSSFPNGTETTFYMNGLRSLISMFKFTPFLPIQNKYLNEVLNVDSVALVSVNVSTVPNYPKCLSATLVLQEFDYRIYMPDLPVPDPDKGEDLNKNMFASTINYEVMRYYYQKPLIKGQMLKGVPFNSGEYIEETLGQKTALQPMNFDTSNIDFYVVDKDFLDIKKMMKQEADNSTIEQLNPLTDDAKAYKENYLMPISDSLKTIIYSDEFLKQMADEANNPSPAYSQKIIENFSGIDLNGVKVRKTAPTILHKEQNFEITFELSNKGLSDFEIKHILQNAAEEAGQAPGVVKSNSFTVNIQAKKGDEKAEVVLDDFARVMLNIGLFSGGMFPGESMQDEIKDVIGDINYENYKSLNFVKYHIENFRIKSMASTFVNSFSQISLQLADGYAPQYVGAQDGVVEIALETTDEDAVRMINQLPKMASMYLREYREVLNVWPIRIDSELTRFMGINEVVIDNVDITTVPNYPGLYSITLRLSSVDRTLKNRELAQKIEKDESLSSTTLKGATIKNTKDFFELKDGLSEADVYPDLELPTINELEKLGYNFIRYTSRPNMRVYPDPDFYFYYGHITGATIFREGILEFIHENGGLENFTLKDIYGDEIEISPTNNGEAFVVNKTSPGVDSMDRKKADIEKAKKHMSEKHKENLNLENKDYRDLTLAELHDVWNVSNDIKCHFREDSYDKYMNGSYKTRIKNKETKIINAINRELSKDFLSEYDEVSNITSSYGKFESNVKKHLNSLFKDDAIKEVIDELALGSSAEKDVYRLFLAIASSRTGGVEYSGSSLLGSDDLDTWRPRLTYPNNSKIPFAIVHAMGQDLSPATYASSVEDAVDNGVIFGPFGLRLYSAGELSALDKGLSSSKQYILDPQYRNASTAKIEEYKRKVMTNEKAALRAVLRETLVWMKLLLENEVLISVYDFISNTVGTASLAESYGVHVDTGFEAQHSDKELSNEEVTRINEINSSIGKIMKENSEALSIGKIFSSCILTATEGANNLLNLILEKDYDSLNGLVQTVKSGSSKDSLYDEDSNKFRKFIKSLVGYKMIDSLEEISEVDRDVKQHLSSVASSKLFIQAAEEPYLYLTHSFYDMIVNDKRGRMLRAFPCYYMMFIDEGREIGFWKLHDNFYNMNAISELQIVKSRKIAADTATITMSNMFQTFDQDDRHLDSDRRYSISDAVKSIFSPHEHAKEEQHFRELEQAPGKVMLKPGIRIHIRMGYGANASMLPVLFNGCITEVGNGESVEIIAQGDGIELTNTLAINRDAEEEKNKDRFVLSRWFHNLCSNGDTPKSILTALLKTDESFTKKTIKNITKGVFNNRNPYGIQHFGDENFKDIFDEGEYMQNIYEAGATATWGKNSRNKDDHINLYAENDAPRLSFELYGKSYWDVMHICKSAAVDYVTGVVPFQFRSSIFYGAPRYYCAYDYEKSEDGTISEKRKPFQQYHIYTSYSDIIKNNLVASERDIKTCGYGVFMKKDILWGSSESTIGPIWVDSDIYPEKQKTMVVNTNLKSKGIPIIGSIPLIGGGASALMHHSADAEGKATGGKSLASRMVCDALKDSIKEMYKGEVIVLGDPSVKPHDKIIISDAYTTINGTAEVEAVVHTFSLEEGFVTSVYPDCISTVDDRFERVAQSITTSAVGKSLAVYTAIVAPSWIFARNTRPLLNQAFAMAGKGSAGATETINTILRLIDKDEISTAKFLGGINNLSTSLGINAYVTSLDSLIGEATRLGRINPLSGADDVASISKALNNLDSRVSSISSKDMISDIDNIINNTTDAAEKKRLMDYKNKIISNQNGIESAVNGIYRSQISSNDISNTVDVLDDIIKKSTNANYASELQSIADGLRGKSSISNAKERQLFNQAISNMTNVSDDVASKANSVLKNTSSLHDNIISNKGVKNAAAQLADGKEIKALSQLGAKGKVGAVKSKIAAFMGGPIGLAIELVASLVIESIVKSAIEREIASLEALKIFPLKKNGRVYTAGLNGSKGIVVGCPSEHDQGLMTSFVGKLFGSDDGMFDSFQGFLLGMFASDRMRELGQKYAGTSDEEDFNVSIKRNNDLLEHLASQEMNKSNAYYAQLLRPRTPVVKNEKGEYSEELKNYYRKNAVTSPKNLESNSNITTKMRPLILNDDMKKLMDKGYMYLSHNQKSNRKEYFFDIRGKTHVINGVVEENSVDLPILAPDAIHLLEVIISEISASKNKKEDMYGEDSWFKTHPIIFQSGLRVGNTISSLGLSFVLTVQNFNGLGSILSKIEKEQREIYSLYGSDTMAYFKYEKSNRASDTYAIQVFPSDV